MSSGPPAKRLKQLALNFATIPRRSQQKEEPAESSEVTVTAEVHPQTVLTTSLSPVVHHGRRRR